MIDFKEIFHIGIRVPNIHAAMKEMGESLNVTWAELVENPSQSLWTPDDGQQSIPLKFVLSGTVAKIQVFIILEFGLMT